MIIRFSVNDINFLLTLSPEEIRRKFYLRIKNELCKKQGLVGIQDLGKKVSLEAETRVNAIINFLERKRDEKLRTMLDNSGAYETVERLSEIEDIIIQPVYTGKE